MGGVIDGLCAKDIPGHAFQQYLGKPTPPRLWWPLGLIQIRNRALGLVALGPSRKGFIIRPS